jgi:hypothetical protein
MQVVMGKQQDSLDGVATTKTTTTMMMSDNR